MKKCKGIPKETPKETRDHRLPWKSSMHRRLSCLHWEKAGLYQYQGWVENSPRRTPKPFNSHLPKKITHFTSMYKEQRTTSPEISTSETIKTLNSTSYSSTAFLKTDRKWCSSRKCSDLMLATSSQMKDWYLILLTSDKFLAVPQQTATTKELFRLHNVVA